VEKEHNFKDITILNQYLGEYVSFYFSWVSFYTSWLIALALPGLALSIYIGFYLPTIGV